MGKVKIAWAVHEKLNILIDKLHSKKYFGYKSEAVKYVLAIYDFVEAIPSQQIHKTSSLISTEFFCRFSPNRRTTYYIIFDVIGEEYLVKKNINNHDKDYPGFIKQLK